MDYINIENENQNSSLIILLVVFHSACPYENYCLEQSSKHYLFICLFIYLFFFFFYLVCNYLVCNLFLAQIANNFHSSFPSLGLPSVSSSASTFPANGSINNETNSTSQRSSQQRDCECERDSDVMSVCAGTVLYTCTCNNFIKNWCCCVY